jgi:aspartate/methionine/tyrosine aminotransferase
MELLTKRSQKFFTFKSFLQEYAVKLSEAKTNHPLNAKDASIDFGVSENKPMIDMIFDRFTKTDMQTYLPQYQYYFNLKGVPALRGALAEFYQERFVKNNQKVKIKAEDLIVTNGASSGFSLLSFCISNPDEYILVETPYYSAISFDINCSSNNHVYFVNSKSENSFVASVADYEDAFQNSKNANKHISAMFIISPKNPIGTFSSKEIILGLLKFAKNHELHVIIDEIYANCIYEKHDQFLSVLSYFDELPDPLSTHFMW